MGVSIDSDPIAHLTAKQLADRYIEGFAFDVPQGHLDAGHGATADDTGHAVTHDRAQHLMPDALDGEGILADNDGGQIFDSRLDHSRPATGLANPVDAAIRLYPHEEPVARVPATDLRRRCIDQKRFNLGNLHRSSPWRVSI